MPKIGTPPRHLLNNNPFKLRRSFLSDRPQVQRDGALYFPDAIMGVASFFNQAWALYERQGFKTLDAWCMAYVEHSSVDVLLFQRLIRERLRLDVPLARNEEMGLETPWHAIDLARAVLDVTNGPCPLWWNMGQGWVAPSRLVIGLAVTKHWEDV